MHDGAVGSSANSTPDANKSSVASDLPVALTSFIGRESQIADLVGHLSGGRLLTLVGAGGVGKSRLALAVAGRVLAEHRVGVTFVELAGLSDADLMPEVVATKLGVHARAGQSTLDALIESLGRSPELLVLDNCEHLRGACATLTRVLLRRCASLQILATSRRALRLEGEVVWRVPPLTLPNDSAKDLVAEFEMSEAVRLFIERARTLVPDFVLTESNATAVADICRQLDGMPLAIELAATRLSVLSPQQINRRLLDRFQFLTTGRSSDPRHRTLRATVDWSHDLLDNAPRVLLRRLAVFVGGFSLEAAECVGADATSPTCVAGCLVLDVLDELVDQSLVIAEQPPGATDVRYRLLETVRQYAAEKLVETGEAAVIRDRHTTWCLSVASPRAPGLVVDSAAVARVRPELDNMRAALGWCLAHGQPAAGLRLAAALGAFWYADGYHWEGSRWLSQLLAVPQNQAPTVERAVALGQVGLFAHMQEQLDASRLALEASLALATQLGEPGVTGMAHQFLGSLAVTTRHFARARRHYEQAITLNRPLPERRATFTAGLWQLGRLALIEGDIPAAVNYADETLAFSRADTEAWSIARALSLRGWIAAHQRDDDMARRYFAQAMTDARHGGFPQLVGNLLVQEAWLDLRADRLADARNHLIEALLLWHRMGAPEVLVYMLQGLAGVSVNVDPLRAAHLAGAASGVERRLQAAPFVTPGAIEPPLVKRWVAAAHRSLGDAAFRNIWAEGESLTDDQAVQYGLETPMPVRAASPVDRRVGDALQLTRREEQIARLVRAGLDNRRIAEELVISRATAERHVSNILHKLGFSSRAEVAAWAATHLE